VNSTYTHHHANGDITEVVFEGIVSMSSDGKGECFWGGLVNQCVHCTVERCNLSGDWFFEMPRSIEFNAKMFQKSKELISTMVVYLNSDEDGKSAHPSLYINFSEITSCELFSTAAAPPAQKVQ